MQQRLMIIPCDLDEAKAFVRQHHRHHAPPLSHKFSIAVADEAGDVRGVAIVGRPGARPLDNGFTMEVTRVATDGCPNACSALYAASWRASRALGYTRLVTYTGADEPGTSLIAAGWRIVAEVKARSWNWSGRPRVDKHPIQKRFRWEPQEAV